MSRVLDLLDRHKALSARAKVWFPLWQELCDLYYPGRGGFTFPLIPGQETPVEIYDNTPALARRGLATAIDGLMKPSTTRWFWMKSKNDELNESDEAKTWFDAVGDRMWSAIYDPTARFIQHSGAVDSDLATFGLGYLWIAENRNRNGLGFRSLHIGKCAIDENSDGQVDTVTIERDYTARQAFQRFGDKVGPKVKEALASQNAARNATKLFKFVQIVSPREDRNPNARDNLNMPFANDVVSIEDEHQIEQSGFEEFPVAVPRWEVSPGEIYPRSPGMMGLPDSRTLQAMGHTLLVGGQRAVDPPTWVIDDAMLSVVRTFPGGLNVVDADAVRQSGGKPIGQLEMGANIPVGREMQDDYRKMVGAAFFKEIFSLPQDQKMTATEVMERKEEFLRTIGPTFGQLENDYIGVIINRVFGIMMRAGAVPPPPDSLAGQDVDFEFMSPIQQAKRQVETAGMARALEFLAPVFQLQPQSAANLDGDAIARDAPDTFGLPQKYIKPQDKVDAQRAAEQQAIQAQGALGEAQQGADVVKTVADAHHAVQKGNAAMPLPAPTQTGIMQGQPFSPAPSRVA